MAYKNLLQPVRMESQFVDTKLHSVFYQTGTTPANAEVTDGKIVTLGSFIADSVYTARYTAPSAPAGLNVRQAIAATSVSFGVCVVDLPVVATKTGNGGTMRDGYKTIGLTAAAGVPVRARKLVVDDVFVTGEDNVSSALTKTEYCYPDAGLWAPSSSAVTLSAYCEVVDSYVISQGVDGTTTSDGVTAYRLLVKAN